MSLAIDELALILVAAAHALLLMSQCQYLKVMLCHLDLDVIPSLMPNLIY